MEVANRIVAEILGGERKVQPGIETRELDELAEEMCRQRRVKPPSKAIAAIPGHLRVGERGGGPRDSRTALPQSRGRGEPGFGVKYEGYYGDAAITWAWGKWAKKPGP